MTIVRAGRWLLGIAAALVVVWAFIDVGARMARQWSARGDDLVTLRVLHWGTPDEEEIVEELIRAFEAQHPGTRVQRLHANDYDAKLKTMLAAGDPPDLFYLRQEDVGEFAASEMVMGLSPYIAADRAAAGGEDWLEAFYPTLVDAFRYDAQADRVGAGELVALPKDFTTLVMYVNRDLYERAGVEVPYDGWTWDQYREAMRKIAALSDPDDPFNRVYGGLLKTWPDMLRQIVWSHGGAFFGGEHGTAFRDVRLDEPASLAALKLIHDVRFEDQSVFNATGISQNEDDLFRRGRIATAGPLGRWMTPRYRKIEAFDWDVVPVPHAEGVEPVSGIATVGWAVSSGTAYPKEAYELLKFLCGRQGQVMTAELGLAMPSMRDVAESDAFLSPGQKPEHAELFVELVGVSRIGQYPRLKEFNRIVEQEVQKSLQLGAKPVERAAADIESRWLEELASPLHTKDYPRMPWAVVGSIAGAGVLLGAGVLGWFAKRERLGPLERAQERAGWAFISPWVVGFLLLLLGPMVVSLLLAVTQWSAMAPLSSARFVGLDNFRHLFQYDASFGQSLWVTTYYTILAVPILQVAALLVALLMNMAVRGIALFRTMYFVPSVVTGVALVTLWITIFNSDQGLLKLALDPVLAPLGLATPDWFGTDSRWFAVPALVIMALWGVGGGMVIYLAGLKSIPGSLYEAARIDGAGKVRQFFAVTMPMLSPLIFFNLVMGIIGSFQVFTQAYVIRGSSGGTNEDLLFYVLNLYDHAFRFHNMGYASAMAWVLFVILLALTLVVFRGSRGMVHYEGLKA